jgi:hypothetical protein
VNLQDLKKIESLAKPAPWEGNLRLTSEPLDRVGVYVQDCVNASPGKDFLFVSAAHDDGGRVDVCHTGNGPTSQANSILIATARNLLPELLALWEAADLDWKEGPGLCLPPDTYKALHALNAKAASIPSPLNP